MTRRFFAALTVLVALVVAHPAAAVQPDEMLKDPALEARARALSTGLRCLVCQNQSIDDSDAPLAHDLRVLIRRRLAAGDSDKQIIDFLVARYGDFILLKPPFAWDTVLLWAVAPGVLVLGAVAIAITYRRRRGEPPSPPLDDGEEAALRRLLSSDGG